VTSFAHGRVYTARPTIFFPPSLRRCPIYDFYLAVARVTVAFNVVWRIHPFFPWPAFLFFLPFQTRLSS